MLSYNDGRPVGYVSLRFRIITTRSPSYPCFGKCHNRLPLRFEAFLDICNGFILCLG